MLKPEHQPLIRVIDDEESVRTALFFMLTSEGFRVKTYKSAQTFLVDDTPSEPGCIIADVRMPGMSGIELFDELRARSYPVPLLFLSGHGDIGECSASRSSRFCDEARSPQTSSVCRRQCT